MGANLIFFLKLSGLNIFHLTFYWIWLRKKRKCYSFEKIGVKMYTKTWENTKVKKKTDFVNILMYWSSMASSSSSLNNFTGPVTPSSTITLWSLQSKYTTSPPVRIGLMGLLGTLNNNLQKELGLGTPPFEFASSMKLVRYFCTLQCDHSITRQLIIAKYAFLVTLWSGDPVY